MKAPSFAVTGLAILSLTACGGGGSSSGSSAPAAPAIPSVAAVSTDATQEKSLEPLVDGAVYTYQCDSGAAPQITVKHFGQVLGVDTFDETSPLPVGRAESGAGSVILGNAADGTLQYFGFVQNGVFTAVMAAVTAADPSPTTGATYTLPDENGGTITSVAQGTSALTVPAGSFSNVYAFHNTYSKNTNLTADFYDVRGVGAVEIAYTNGAVHDRCLLSSDNLLAVQ